MQQGHGCGRASNAVARFVLYFLARPALSLPVYAILLVGCHANTSPNRQVLFPQQDRQIALMPVFDINGGGRESLAEANACFAEGARREREGHEGCVDLYYQAAFRAWQHLEAAASALACSPDYRQAYQLYQRSLHGLVTNAIRYERLDPRGRLIIADSSGRRAVPIEYYGFAWKPGEFCQVLPASVFAHSDLQNHYHTCGLGIALVAVRHACVQEPYYRSKQPFSVTAILRSLPRGADEGASSSSRPCDPVLTFFNPCLIDAPHVGSTVIDMDRDLSAPFAYQLREAPRRFTEGFLNPDDADVKPKLLMIEPYQRGKVPVVFIHGLWSDPMTWVDTVNELRAQSDLYRRYQFWCFQYPTGGELLQSATELREKLLLVREQFDSQHGDPALERMVLVGHSMGGLIAQLQATYSYDILWRHAANRPPEAVRTTPDVSQRLQRMFFFDPSPLVKRVVFIGTPHHGSGMSRRLVGRVASSLVRYSGPESDQYQRLMEDNKDVFKEFLWNARPTSVELLEPSNPLLLAMSQMPFGCGVQLHSIIGTGGRTLTGELTDGVVPVSSARQPGVCSELFISVHHGKLHRDPACVAELTRILRQHDLQDTRMLRSRHSQK
jgi:pimeloyl-ACP methyl ester carboxylesterase